jgi:hypothetical protein
VMTLGEAGVAGNDEKHFGPRRLYVG